MSARRIVALTALNLAAMVLLPLAAASGDVRAWLMPDPWPQLAKLQVWLAMVAAQAVAWACVLAWIVPHVPRLLRDPTTRSDVGWCAVFVGALLFPPLGLSWYLRAKDFPPAYIAGVHIVRFIGATGIVVAAFAMAAAFLAHRGTLVAAGRNRQPASRMIALAAGTRDVDYFFMAAAMTLALGVVGTAAQRIAIGGEPASISRQVIVFGVLGTLQLLAGYLPLRIALYRQSVAAIDQAIGPAPSHLDDLPGWLERRAAFEQLLGHDAKSFFGLGGVLSTFLPFVVASASKLLGG